MNFEYIIDLLFLIFSVCCVIFCRQLGRFAIKERKKNATFLPKSFFGDDSIAITQILFFVVGIVLTIVQIMRIF